MLKTYSHNLNKRHRTQVKKNITSKTEINPIQGGRFQGCSRMGWGGGGGKKAPFSKICHTYPTLMKLGTVIPYLRKIKKIHKSRDTPFDFC